MGGTIQAGQRRVYLAACGVNVGAGRGLHPAATVPAVRRPTDARAAGDGARDDGRAAVRRAVDDLELACLAMPRQGIEADTDGVATRVGAPRWAARARQHVLGHVPPQHGFDAAGGGVGAGDGFVSARGSVLG